ncbi:MAG: hypothetical protein KGL31_11095 [candidate division NC10 bacterium]|nr:hypothetical protein [candidate division NC10 bacterium]MDE2322439.1 hypothetical protein [candidate division NC10 bacterium]
MKLTVLVAVVLILNIVGHDRPMAFAQTVDTVVPQFTGTPSSTHGEQTAPGSDSRTAPLPDLQGFPTAPAPFELAALTLPNNFTEVTALFERLPPNVAGHGRSAQLDRIAPERSTVGYGEDRRMARLRALPLLHIQAIDLTKGDFFPINWKAGHVVAMMARHSEEVAEFGQDGSLFWVRQNTFIAQAQSMERFPRYGMVWGRADSPWIFSVQADTPESRDALLAAFVAAAKSAQR